MSPLSKSKPRVSNVMERRSLRLMRITWILLPTLILMGETVQAAERKGKEGAKTTSSIAQPSTPTATPETVHAQAPQPSAAVAPALVSPRSDKHTVLVLDLRANGVDNTLAQQATVFVSDAFEVHDDYSVLTMEDVRKMVSHEETKSLAGCDSGSCMADLTKLTHAEMLVSGSVGKVGNQLAVHLVLMDDSTTQVRNRTTGLAASVRELPDAVHNATTALFGWTVNVQAVKFQLPKGVNVSFAVLDLQAAGVAESVAINLTQILSTELKKIDGASVISRDDIKAMLQLEEDKSRLGCDSTSCLAEIGGALGVEKLITGSVGKLADSFVISLRLISVRGTRVENRISESFTGSEEQLIRAIRHAGRRLLGIETEQTGTLAVGASEDGASVMVDGVRRGALPMPPLAGLKPGPHTLQLVKGGYFDWKGDVYVDPGDSTILWAELKAKPLKWYQKWWVWTIMGSATASVVVATVLLAATGAGVVAAVAWFSRPPATSGSGEATVGN